MQPLRYPTEVHVYRTMRLLDKIALAFRLVLHRRKAMRVGHCVFVFEGMPS